MTTTTTTTNTTDPGTIIDDPETIVGFRMDGFTVMSARDVSTLTTEDVEDWGVEVWEVITEREAMTHYVQADDGEDAGLYLSRRLATAQRLARSSYDRGIYNLDDLETDDEHEEDHRINGAHRYVLVSEPADADGPSSGRVFLESASWDITTSTFPMTDDGWIPLELWDLDTERVRKLTVRVVVGEWEAGA